MPFSDPRYLLLLGLVASILPLMRQGAPRLLAIGLISLGFYVGLNAHHWYPLVVVSLTAYAGGLTLSRLRDGFVRVATFATLLVVTLLPLLFFKYAAAVHALLPPTSDFAIRWAAMAKIALPIGLSFYTFLAVGYLIDVYVSNVAAERSVIRFGAFMSFFPHLAAGPIERARHLLPQLERIGVFDYSRAVSGLRTILVGLFMKVVIADNLAPYVNAVYAEPRQHGAVDLALATVLFSFQVYADFAGYSLIAIGSARVLGVELLKNFEQPWLSQSVPDYWRRWHISLSSWFRDYLFIPLQFQVRRRGAFGLIGALIFTFILVGVWHGAGIKYALFGLIHGILVAFSTLTFARRDEYWRSLGVPRLPLLIGRTLATFVIISLTFVLFRARDLSDAVWIYGALVTGAPGDRTISLRLPAVLIALLVTGDLLASRGKDLARLPFPARWAAYYVASASIIVVTIDHALQASPHVQQFIYFQF